MHDVADHQLARRHQLPASVAPRPRLHLQALAQDLQRVARAPLLHPAHDGVERQQRRDHDTFTTASEHELQHDRQLEHPRDRPPEVPGQLQQRVAAFLARLVGPVPDQPLGRLRSRQPDQTLRRRRCRIFAHDAFYVAPLPRRTGIPATTGNLRQ
ncbi:MAG TPA: hypothetical protein PK435_12520 [Thermoanaerobaculaceae bacterium]|nr:hypothetical protein [Thermoanaerobaculaceae bacterium]